MAEQPNNKQPYFQPFDVSKPVRPRKEAELIEERLAIGRRAWLQEHKTHFFIAIGIAVVVLFALFIFIYARSTNPMGRLVHSASKDFGTSFDYHITFSRNDNPYMTYDGAVEVNRGAHTVNAYYSADYVDYTYKGALMTEDNNAFKGSCYQEKWSVEDCTNRAQDFFEFDSDFKRGDFNGGALLRFLGLNTKYSAEELEKLESRFRSRLSASGDYVTIRKTSVEGGTEFVYEIKMNMICESLVEEGAPLFYRSTDYDSFKLLFEANRTELEQANCTMRYVVDSHGYLSEFSLTVETDDELYAMDCEMSNFGTAEVNIPDSFKEAVTAEGLK